MRGTSLSPSPFHPPCIAAKEDKPPMHFLNQQYKQAYDESRGKGTDITGLGEEEMTEGWVGEGSLPGT